MADTKKYTVYEFIAVYTPKDGKPEFAVDWNYNLFVNEDAARAYVARKIPEQYADKLEDVEIMVRPFGR